MIGRIGDGDRGAMALFFFSGRRRHTRCGRDWSSDVCSSDLLFDMVEGGELQVVGTSPGPLPQAPMDFEVWAADYSLVEAPAMARLLTIASLSGLGNVLAGEGIAFQRLTGNVQLADGRLSSDLVRAFGPSLGITARGHLDLEGSDSDVRGTLVPAYSINRVLGAIPLLGFLLTGGERS